MTEAFIINAGLNIFVLSSTPVQRWQAARWFNINFGEKWFIATSVVVLIILTLLFIVVTYKHSKEERQTANRLFYEYADERGLSPRERHILMYIATKAKLKHKESIFTMADAFDRGATKIIRASITLKGANKRRHLSAELSVLREKLGFKKRGFASVDTLITERPSSRQIPTGKKLYITSLERGDVTDIESVVIENSDIELIVKTPRALETVNGESLCVRYYFGASIWEFETSVIGCMDNILILNHNDNIRFVNRRRFLRVPINEPAYIAAFPFARTLPDNVNSELDSDSSTSSRDTWGPPDFVPADVTELAGPGLRVVAPLEVKVGDRIVVILKLSKRKSHSLTTQMDTTALNVSFSGNGRIKPSRIVEDIGVVRHTKAVENGFSIAVELTGLSDANLNELVRATNAASIKERFKTQLIPAATDGQKKKSAVVSKTAVV
jgi:hypothetical protein